MIRVVNVRGRMLDAKGKDCGVTALAVPVEDNAIYSIIFGPAEVSAGGLGAFVWVGIAPDELRQSLQKDKDDDTALKAIGALFSDESKKPQLDAHGQTVYDSTGAVIMQYVVAYAGLMTGVRLLAGTSTIRVDCAAVPSMWIECDLAIDN